MTPKEGTALAIGGLLAAAIVGAFLLGWRPLGAGGAHGLGVDDAGSVVEVVPGEQVVLRLEGNPTTGYVWQVTALDSAVLALAAEPDYESSSDADGAGGTYTFRFEAIAPGRTEVVLHYFPSWEGPSQAVETFAFTTVVAEQG